MSERLQISCGSPELANGATVTFEANGGAFVRHCAWCIPGKKVKEQYPTREVSSGICPDHYQQLIARTKT